MKKFFALLLFITLGVFGHCAASQPQDAKITILHTNDHHGHFWKNENGEAGLAAQKTLVDKIRQEVKGKGGAVLVLSAGDINTGVPESDLQDAEPDFTAMSAIGYDAMAIGNHEFDKPIEVLAQQKQWASFPFLSANIVKKSDGKPLYDAYKLFDLNGLKVAVFGLVAGDTYLLSNPEHLKTVDIKDPILVAKNLVPQLRKQADVVIAISHMGYYEGGKHGSNSPGDVTLAQSVAGIDIIVGGHSHTKLEKTVLQNGVIIIQANDQGKYLGRLDVAFKKGKLTEETYRLIPINLKKKVEVDGKSVRVFIEEEIPEDSALLALLTPYQDKGKDRLGIVIGSTTGEFEGERDIVRNRETNLGNLLARSQRLKVGADIGIINAGGIRASMASGNITYKDVLKVQPFSNTICTAVLSGKELKEYLAVAVNKTPGSGAFAQFDNVVIKLDGQTITSIMVDGKAVTDDGSYKIAINDFAARGGDGYMNIAGHPTFVNTGYVDADILREFVTLHSPLNPDDFKPTNDVIR